MVKNLLAVLGSEYQGRGIFVVISNTPKISASDVCKLVASLAGGNGGGTATFAKGGCSDGSRVDNAIAEINKIIPVKYGLEKVAN